MKTYKQLTELQNTKEKEWYSEVQISDGFIAYHAKVLAMLSIFQHMWDENFDEANAAKHGIDLIFELIAQDKRPILSASYKADLRAQVFKKREVDQMLAMDVMKFAQAK